MRCNGSTFERRMGSLEHKEDGRTHVPEFGKGGPRVPSNGSHRRFQWRPDVFGGSQPSMCSDSLEFWQEFTPCSDSANDLVAQGAEQAQTKGCNLLPLAKQMLCYSNINRGP